MPNPKFRLIYGTVRGYTYTVRNEEDIHALCELLGSDFVLLIRPLAVSCVFVKLACNCMLSGIKDDIADVTSPCQFAVGCKGGCESLQWAL